MKTNALIVTNGGPADTARDIRDIKPPFSIPIYWPWILGAVMLTAFAVGAFLIWNNRRKYKAKPPIIPPVPAHVRAREKLAEALNLFDEPKRFCILVSDTVRWYLEERYSFRAPERTTEEFLHELQGTDLLLPDQKQSLGEFLSECDMVKFARYEPGRPELQALHDSAVRLVMETEPQPIVAAPPMAGTEQPTA